MIKYVSVVRKMYYEYQQYYRKMAPVTIFL